MALSIDRINTYSSRLTIVGWFAGLSWFDIQFGHSSVSWYGWLILVVGGMFASSIVIGGGVALIMAGLTKLLTGRSDGSPKLFLLGLLVSPVVAFFVATPLALLL